MTSQAVQLAVPPASVAEPIHKSDTVKPGTLFKAVAPGATFTPRFTPETAKLEWLSCGEYALEAGAKTELRCNPTEESLLFMWKGSVEVEVGGQSFSLAPYDTLYIPRGAEFQISNPESQMSNSEPAKVIQCSATADNVHPVHHSRFAEYSQREDRIRHLAGKDVFMMFDVPEPADKLIAGYTFFQPYQRSWPPHNHTDQEETYIFIKGHGAMEVYESPEKLCFVTSVNEGDLVTIPMMNYHPVFSQESPLEFIWCIAGARYWVGDKNKDFMQGKGDSITT
ncbi:MAG TPA: 5-deoxy-glucuronate isomerase [Blastocatellia bacterium]|nr:5-deoxy-glucuronate isomerase [Blastocatellia bacterium]HMV84143.1 5-deoxy-glucuronate isomerase [Blastocatellia bacterium]HMX25278.1 5-deoxy-glucuronate isomerase [Blastocatellia bacterium]HMY71306.1 5-deoxy-glucuronate isomerase [Blastocatellia bacterium]HMZ19871.1 5-deoxy-glucuronate isomerase [Blastocatellia bacterium]